MIVLPCPCVALVGVISFTGLGSSDVGTLTAYVNGPTLAVRAATGFR